MFTEYTDNYGVRWISCNLLHMHRALKSGPVFRANLRWLQDRCNPHLIYYDPHRANYPDATGQWPYRLQFHEPQNYALVIASTVPAATAYVRVTEDRYHDAELVEAVYALENYPAFDDEYVSNAESDILSEAWDSWLFDEVMNNLPDAVADDMFRAWPDDYDRAAICLAEFTSTLTECCVCPVFEDSGDVDVNIAPVILSALAERIKRRLWRK